MNPGPQLFRNSTTLLLNIGIGTTVALVLPPFIVRYLGFDEYGIWSLIVLSNAYIGLLDLGFQSSLIVLIADAFAKQDKNYIIRLLSTVLWLYILMFLIGLVIAFYYGSIFIDLLLYKNSDSYQYLVILQFYLSICFFNLMVIPFSSLLKGLQRYDQASYCEITALIINALTTVSLLALGYEMWALVLGTGIAAISRLLGNCWFAHRLFSPLCLQWPTANTLVDLKALIRLSPVDQSVRVHSVVSQTVIRLSLNAYAGVASVGIYDIAKRLVSQINGVPAVVFAPLTPAVATMAARQNWEQIQRLLEKALLYLGMLALPLVYFTMMFFTPLLQAWLGISDVSQVKFAAQLLIIATLIELFTGPATVITVGLGSAKLHISKILLTLFLLGMLVPLGGYFFAFEGILLGEGIATVVASLFALFAFEYWYKIKTLKYVWYSLLRVSIALFPVCAVLFASWCILIEINFWKNNLLTWFFMFLLMIMLTILSYRLFGLISNQEKNYIKGLLSRRNVEE